MSMATTYVTWAGHPLRIDYHPHRVRQAGTPIADPAPKEQPIGTLTVEAEDVAVVETLEPATLPAQTISTAR